MALPEPKPVYDHISEWTRDEKASAAEAVKGLLETDGWKAIQRSVEDRLRFEQMLAMRGKPTGDDAGYERMLGQWAGLRQVTAIAEGIVVAGEEAEREMRSAA